MTPEVKWPTLYDDTEVYGVAGWGNESARNTGLYEFCVALPKGAELHAHEMTLLPFERYVEIVRRDAWILLEEGDRCGYLFAENNPNRPENTVLLDDALTGGLISMEELSIRNAYYKVRKEHPDFRVRIIGATGKDQRYPLDMCFETFRFFIRLSREFKDEFDPDRPQDFIIGLDLVNEEDSSKPLNQYFDFFLSDEMKNSGLKLFLHCGESLRPGNTSVKDAYAAGTYRAGHAFNLYRFPALMKKFSENSVTVEVCPTSNLALGYVHDLRLHPALYYLNNGVPIVICSDDGLFMTPGPLVDDFYSAVLCWDLSLEDIREICERSILAGGLCEEETDYLLEVWRRSWTDFCSERQKAIQDRLTS